MKHVPVLLDECIRGLEIKPGGLYVDGTTGRGGHAGEIAKYLTTGRLIAIDRDEEAINETKKHLHGYADRIIYIRGNFRDISKIMDSLEIEYADGMLFDLGVSSPHLDDTERGFSYMHSTALDMRMDKQDTLTAYEIVNTWQEDRLRKIFYEYGEERYAPGIARAIVRKRAAAPVETTFELNDIILSAIPPAARREPQHPSKRCYQAIRVAVNDELGALDQMLETAPDRLRTGGRICVISFHSLEDRAVKNKFAALSKGCICPADFPVCVCGVKPSLKIITRKPLICGKDELDINSRARSAKLRIAERI